MKGVARWLILLGCLGAVLLAGCKEEAEVRTTVYDEAETATRNGPEQPVLPPPQRQEFIETVRAELTDIDQAMEKMKDKVEALPESARDEYTDELEELRQNREVLREKLTVLQDAGAEAWHQIQTDVQALMADLKQGVQDLAARLDKV